MNKISTKQDMIRTSLRLMALATTLLLVSCHSTKIEKTSPINPGEHYQQLTNYGEANLATFSTKLTNAANHSVHIVQLGDSHTAADFFTGQLRDRFQKRFHNGGIGFVNPVAVPGQRYSHIIFSHDKKAWNVLTSRKDKSDQFPLGGFIAEPTAQQSSLSIKLRTADNQRYLAQALYSSASDASLAVNSSAVNLAATNGQWRFSPTQPVSFPLEATASSGQGLKLGGWFITREQPGAIVSALGINGATLTMVDKWQPQWIDTLAQTKPDMIILSYGTNEAFNDTLDLANYKQQLEQKVIQIRQSMPQAVILLMGPSDSIKNKNQSGCQRMQPQPLNAVIQIQREVAQAQDTLFWDWRAFMGRECSIQNWAAEGNAQPDLVHLSQNGYKKSADAMYSQLMVALGLK
ncbi:SGNH/GDSL hydrolase family protein [Budvicia diplopodorum]|uniref:SGNH/GDSL hydrolase family protein n=1 Tax=Budvicia diplopodorum TaxID=1119056 RepID=UPI0013592FC1|nr:SGNH/GDSL hydrolase family protein [Budvicia diplopodorum]